MRYLYTTSKANRDTKYTSHTTTLISLTTLVGDVMTEFKRLVDVFMKDLSTTIICKITVKRLNISLLVCLIIAISLNNCLSI